MEDFFKEWGTLPYNIGHRIGIFGIGADITPDSDGVGAEDTRHFHRHSGVNTESACFITTRSDDTAITSAADEYGATLEPTVYQSLTGDKESVEVEMDNSSLHESSKST